MVSDGLNVTALRAAQKQGPSVAKRHSKGIGTHRPGSNRKRARKMEGFQVLGVPPNQKKTLEQFSIESYGFQDLPFLGKPTPKGVYIYIYVYMYM